MIRAELREHQRDWNDHEFFATGEREVAERMDRAAALGRPRRRTAALVSSGFLYGRLGLHPMRMLAVPRAEVTTLLGRTGALHTYYVAPTA